jgi:hypothetical protein
MDIDSINTYKEFKDVNNARDFFDKISNLTNNLITSTNAFKNYIQKNIRQYYWPMFAFFLLLYFECRLSVNKGVTLGEYEKDKDIILEAFKTYCENKYA